MTDLSTITMTEHDARRLTERIRITAHNYTEAKAKLLELVQEAKDGGVYDVLGYASWQAYLAEVLGDEPLRLARDDRQDMVKVLSAEGMSTRAIAPIVGTHHDTVASDLKTPTVGNPTVAEPRVSHGMDGKTRIHQPKPEPVESDHKPSQDLAIINDIRLYLGAISSSPEIARLTPVGKQHIIDALNNTITQIQRS